MKGKGDEKSIEKWESKIDHPKFFLPSAVLGQLRKTIDRISTRITRTTYEKTELFKGCLELSMYLWCAPPLPPHLPTQSSFLELFERKRWKENGMRKVRIQDLTIQSWNCLFLKGNNERKMGWEKKESTILPFKVQSCRFWKENCERKRRWEKYRKVGIQDRASKVLPPQCCARTAAQNYR